MICFRKLFLWRDNEENTTYGEYRQALLILVSVDAIFGYMIYRSDARRRTQEKRNDQFHVRV
jgi:hypothetical protein